MNNFIHKFLSSAVLFGACLGANAQNDPLQQSKAQPAAKDGEKATVYMVANAHWDTQWNWDIQRSINEFLPNTLKQNFALMEQYPDYVFSLEGAVKYDMAKEYMPELYDQLVKYVKEGRWHVSGSGWDANDPNMPSVESNIRNYLYGQTFYKNEFGVKSTDVMLPDCFGFNYLIPTVANHCGIIGFGTQKLGWRYKPFYENGRKVPFNFGIWEGLDGSRIMAAMDGGGYGWIPSKMEDVTDNKEQKERVAEASIPAVYRYFGTKSSRLHGDQGGSPTPLAVDLIHAAAQKEQENYNVKFASTDQMYLDYYMDPRLKVFKGELLMDVHATGCYTSHTEIKKLNRQIEYLLGAAEALGVLAEQMGVMEYPSFTLDQIWKRTLVHQFHDDLTGTSIPEAYINTYNDHYLSVNQLESLIGSQMKAIGATLNTKVSGTPLLVYNPVGSANKSAVTATVELPAKYSGVAVYDAAGRRMKAQIISREGDKATIAFNAVLPSLSVSVFEVRPSSAAASSLKVGKNYIENSIYKVTVNEDGDICSIVDKRYGKQLVAKDDAMGLRAFGDNRSNSWPAWEIIRSVMEQEPVKVNSEVKISTEYIGALKAALRIEKKYGESSFVQRIVLTSGASDERIDIENEIDWQSQATLLKASFPLAFDCKEAEYDLGLGSIRRGNNTDIAYEVPAQKWADMTADDGSYGVTIVNDSKYGWDKPNDNTLRLTLLHTPVTEKNFAHQNTMDLGVHSFTYSIIGHKGALNAAAADAAADIMNQPCFVCASTLKQAGAQRQVSLLSSDNPSIRVKAVKKAIDGNGYIVRTYEQSGKAGKATLKFRCALNSASIANGIEEDQADASFKANELTVDAKAYGLNTYRVHLDCVKAAEGVYESVVLPYNTVGISTDAFSAFGLLSKKGYSYASEILPSQLNVCGVPYSFAKADFANVVLCDGQSVALPEGTKTVHLLVASLDGEKKAVFNAGKDIEAQVGYFSGIYGQYGWKGYYDSFMREGKVAYVGTHRHSAYKRNEAYIPTYMFMVEVPVSEGCRSLTLPSDKDVIVLSATAAK